MKLLMATLTEPDGTLEAEPVVVTTSDSEVHLEFDGRVLTLDADELAAAAVEERVAA